jgi:histone-arginine methyltransferase CARM1
VIINGRVQQVELPEKVDIIISEPIGFLLVHERMLEVYVIARNRFLKPGGLMYPSSGSIVFAPLTDEALFQEQVGKSVFWENSDFYGVNISNVRELATREYLSQPVVGYFPSSNLLSTQRAVHTIDFREVSVGELQDFEIEFNFRIDRTALLHGFGCWFDVNFEGSASVVTLSTSPDCPGTHWYQCRLLLSEPLGVNRGQYVFGTMAFKANDKFSFNITLTATIDGTEFSSTNYINLHDQVYLCRIFVV